MCSRGVLVFKRGQCRAAAKWVHLLPGSVGRPVTIAGKYFLEKTVVGRSLGDLTQRWTAWLRIVPGRATHRRLDMHDIPCIKGCPTSGTSVKVSEPLSTWRHHLHPKRLPGLGKPQSIHISTRLFCSNSVSQKPRIAVERHTFGC